MDAIKSGKIRRMMHHFPDFTEEICAEILEGLKWNVEEAIEHMGGTPTLQCRPDAIHQELSDWPKLSEATKIPAERGPIPRRLSRSSTPEKAPVNRQRSQNGSSTPSPLLELDRLQYSRKREDLTPPPIVKRSVTSTSALVPDGKSPDLIVEPLIKRFPPGVNPEHLRQALKAELLHPEIRHVLYKVAPQPGKASQKLLVLVRGVPGSGKTRLSQLIVGVAENGVHLSADHFFINNYGSYVFQPQKLGEAHEQTRQKCLKAMESNSTPIVIDNTNTMDWEMLPYVNLALKYGYEILMLEPSTSWKRNANILAAKTVHGVPKAKISEMLKRFDANLTVPKLIEMAQKEGEKSTNVNYTPKNVKLMKKASLRSLGSEKELNTHRVSIFDQSDQNIEDLEQYSRSSRLFEITRNSIADEVFSNEVEGGPSTSRGDSDSSTFIIRKKEVPQLDTTEDFWNTVLAQEYTNEQTSGSPDGIGSLSSLTLEGEEEESLPLNSRLAATFPGGIDSIDSCTANRLNENYGPSRNPEWTNSGVAYDLGAGHSLNPLETEEDAITRRMQEDVDRLLSDDVNLESFTDSVENEESPSTSDDPSSAVSFDGAFSPENNIHDKFAPAELDSDAVNVLTGSMRERANKLQNLFPTVSSDQLDDIFQKCNGDLAWCLEVLLDGSYLMSGSPSGPRESLLSFNENGDLTPAPTPVAFESVKSKRKKSRSRKSRADETISSSSALSGPKVLPPPILVNEFELLNGPLPTPPTRDPSALGAASLPSKSKPDASRGRDDIFVPTDGADWFDMDLAPEFVNELMAMYSNPFGLLDAQHLSKEHLRIRIPPKMAFKMFQFFFLSVAQKTGMTEVSPREHERQERDEEEENAELIEDLISMDNVTSSVKPDFEKLMELELRLTTRDNQYVQQKRNEIQRTMASTLTVAKFHGAFPSLSKEHIEDAYYQNNRKYGDTLKALQIRYPSQFVPEGLNDDFPLARNIIRNSVQEEVKTIEQKTNCSGQPDNEVENLTATEWRALATRHCFLKMEHADKMRKSYRGGQNSMVAGYYAHMSRMHQERMVEANKRAAELIVAEFNNNREQKNVIDLHNLFVREAIHELQLFLNRKTKSMESHKAKTLELRLIVGRGLNSQDSVPKLAQSVEKFLKTHHYSYVSLPGNIVVTLHVKDKSNVFKF